MTSRTTPKALTPVTPAEQAAVSSLVTGKRKAGNQSAAVLGTGQAAPGWQVFLAECFLAPAGSSSLSALWFALWGPPLPPLPHTSSDSLPDPETQNRARELGKQPRARPGFPPSSARDPADPTFGESRWEPNSARAQDSIPARASSPLLTSPGPDRRPFGRGSGAGQSPIKTCRGSLAPTGTEDGDRDAVTTPLPAAPPHTCGPGAWPRPPSPWPRPLGTGPAPAPRTGCSQFWAQVAAFPSLPPAVRGRRWRQGAPRPIDARVIYSRELKARSLPSNSRQRLPWERLQAPLQ